MMKPARKLVLRGEALRTLANMDLAHVIGGGDSGAVQCPVAADSGRVQCPAPQVASGTTCPAPAG